MGPIETELRAVDIKSRWAGGMSKEAFRVASDASDTLGLKREFLTEWSADAEVLSEAVEAAEALRL